MNKLKCGKRHLMTVFLFSASAIAFLIRSCMSVAIVAMTDKLDKSNPVFDWDSQQKSLILSSPLWGAVTSQFPMAYLVRNGGSHKLLFYGMMFCSIVNLLIPVLAIHAGWIAVFCCRVFTGIGQGCLTPGLKKLVANWIPISERSLLGSFALSGAQIGNVMALSLSGVIAKSVLGWPSIFYIFGAIGIVWSIMFYWLTTEYPSEDSTISIKEKEFIESGCSVDQYKTDRKFPWKAVFTSTPVWALLTVSCLYVWCYNMLLTKIPSFMKSVLKFDIEKSGVISALPYLLKWFIMFPAGSLSDFAQRKGVSITVIRKVCNSFALWGASLMLLIMCILRTQNATVTVVLLILTEGFSGGAVCGYDINELDICPNYAGFLASIVNTCAKICGLLAPIACGFIVTEETNADQWYIVFYISVGFYFIGNMVFIVFGTAEIQPWNGEISKSSDTENVYRLSTISKISMLHEN